MISIRHNPGPWSLMQDPKFPSLQTVVDRQGKDVETVVGSDPQEIATARLIAAAPGLLDALRGWLEWYPNHHGAGCNSECRVCHAIKIVAKAEGRHE